MILIHRDLKRSIEKPEYLLSLPVTPIDEKLMHTNELQGLFRFMN